MNKIRTSRFVVYKRENDERAMNCEICKVIQKLGLRKSVHKLWLCTDKQMLRRRRRVAIVERTNRRLSKSFA
jgi:hypothetical protein